MLTAKRQRITSRAKSRGRLTARTVLGCHGANHEEVVRFRPRIHGQTVAGRGPHTRGHRRCHFRQPLAEVVARGTPKSG
jgi:hypothetical protein